MSGYKPYPKYKESGVEWLGDVPDHWTHMKIKHVCTFSGGATPSTENDSYWNGEIPWVTSKDMKSEYIVDSEDHISQLGLDSCASSMIPIHTIIICARSGILKHTIPIAMNSVPVCLNQDLRALQFDSEYVIPIFILRWVQGLQEELLFAWRKQGATVESLEHDYIANQSIYFPSLSEQKSVATFLDRETSKLDILIREQKELITLLQEKRQALISNAVTKGLNPKAKMKDSGVEWLGEVPEHWSHLKIKHICHFSGGATPSTENESYWNGDIPWVTSKDMKSEFISDSEDHISQAGLDSCSTSMLPSGCVIICARSGILKHTIPIAITTVPVALNQDIRALQFDPNWTIPEFILRWVQGLQEELLFAWRKQGATVESLEHDYISRQSIFIPSLTEQNVILAYLRKETKKLDALIKVAEETIDLMHEHRASLISEAVTGKIDVRTKT